MQFFDKLQRDTQAAQSYLYAAPVLADLATGEFGLATYIRFLTNAYHHVKHTVPLMMACGASLPKRLTWMQRPLCEYIEEEVGHEQWILNDLSACGVDPDSVAASDPRPAVEVMVAYEYDYIRRHNPIGFFGMVYVLEGTSTALATHAAGVIQNQLGLPDEAFSYLTSHGDLDTEHVAFYESLVNRVESQQDQAAIVHVANQTFRLYGDVIRDAKTSGVRHAA